MFFGIVELIVVASDGGGVAAGSTRHASGLFIVWIFVLSARVEPEATIDLAAGVRLQLETEASYSEFAGLA